MMPTSPTNPSSLAGFVPTLHAAVRRGVALSTNGSIGVLTCPTAGRAVVLLTSGFGITPVVYVLFVIAAAHIALPVNLGDLPFPIS